VADLNPARARLVSSAAVVVLFVGCVSAEGGDDFTMPVVVDGGSAGAGDPAAPWASGGQSGLPPPVSCGNGVVDPGEDCEGTTAQTCAAATMGALPLGQVGCTGCRLDVSGCFSSNPGGAGGGSSLGTGGAGSVPQPAEGGATGAGGSSFGAGGSAVVQPVPPGNGNPIIPAVTGDCPQFTNATITFMGLGGIQIVAGAMPPGPTAPMVFYWHGTGGSAGEFAIQAGAIQQGVVQEGGVLVSFQNTTGGDLRSGTLIFGEGDYKIADQLVACAVRDHNIDPRRIFATGCSAGGLFSTAMAAERSNYIAAAAPNSGGFVLTLPFQGAAKPALMTMHGAAGRDVVVVDFAQTSAAADTAFKAQGSFVIDCDTGGGHCGAGSLAPAAWQFFETHPYGVSPEPWSGGLPPGFPSVCTIK